MAQKISHAVTGLLLCSTYPEAQTIRAKICRQICKNHVTAYVVTIQIKTCAHQNFQVFSSQPLGLKRLGAVGAIDFKGTISGSLGFSTIPVSRVKVAVHPRGITDFLVMGHGGAEATPGTARESLATTEEPYLDFEKAWQRRQQTAAM